MAWLGGGGRGGAALEWGIRRRARRCRRVRRAAEVGDAARWGRSRRATKLPWAGTMCERCARARCSLGRRVAARRDGFVLHGLVLGSHLLPALLLVLFGREEVRILVRAPGEHVALHAEDLALPLLLAAAPRLHEVVLLRVVRAACRAVCRSRSTRAFLPASARMVGNVGRRKGRHGGARAALGRAGRGEDTAGSTHQSGKSSLRFQRFAHSSTVMIL